MMTDAPQKRIQDMIEQRRRNRSVEFNSPEARIAENERAIKDLRRIILANALKEEGSKEGERN